MAIFQVKKSSCGPIHRYGKVQSRQVRRKVIHGGFYRPIQSLFEWFMFQRHSFPGIHFGSKQKISQNNL
jgi:hypothetical protein